MAGVGVPCPEVAMIPRRCSAGEHLWCTLIGVAKLLTKAEANYRRASEHRVSCDTCRYMNDDGTCQQVDGIVKPTMVCDLWRLKR